MIGRHSDNRDIKTFLYTQVPRPRIPSGKLGEALRGESGFLGFECSLAVAEHTDL
jgi:hypothetical protein